MNPEINSAIDLMKDAYMLLASSRAEGAKDAASMLLALIRETGTMTTFPDDVYTEDE